MGRHMASAGEEGCGDQDSDAESESVSGQRFRGGEIVDAHGNPLGEFDEIAAGTTEEAFHTYWQPACAALHLQWVPLFHTGLPLKQEDISVVIEELGLLKQWLSCHSETGVPQAVMMRIDQLVQALQNVQGNAQVAVYIG
jgi:hypothetical protein